MSLAKRTVASIGRDKKNDAPELVRHLKKCSPPPIDLLTNRLTEGDELP